MKRKLTAGLTSATLPIFIQDSSSTTGGGLGGLTHTTPGLVAEYRRQGQTSWTAISLVAGSLGTFTSGGIVADGSLAGAYEFDPPDAALASGARWVAIRLRGAANMLPCLIEIELDAINYQDPVRGGLTALPNAIPGAAGGLLTRGVGTGQLNPNNGNVSVNGDQFGNTLLLPLLALGNQLPILRANIADGGGSSSIELDPGASSVDGWYTGATVIITSGPGEGQYRTASAYIGSSRTLSVSVPWTTQPTSASTFCIVAPSSGGGGGGSGDASQATLLAVKAKTDLIVAGQVQYVSMVNTEGQIDHPIFIGDDYLATYGSAFDWTIPAVTGLAIGQAVFKFGGANDVLQRSWLTTGVVTDLGGGFWRCRAELTNAVTGALKAGQYDWTAEVSGPGGIEFTKIYSAIPVEVKVKRT